MRLTSTAFQHNGKIPSKYTCDGLNISPPLEIYDIPKEAKTLALIMEDPDVPKKIRPDGMWDHWIVWNIDPKIISIGNGKEPEGVEGKTTYGRLGYGGPCPPDREHRYFFKVYALNIKLKLPEGSSKQELLKAMQGHIIDNAELIGRYERI